MNARAKQARRDTDEETGPTSDELAELARLRREVKELKRANEILKSAAELDPPTTR